MNLKQTSKRLKNELPAVFLSLKDKETPTIAKVFAMITIIYALSPIDLIPDFIPVIGYLDDLIILPALIALTLKFIPKEVFEKNLRNSKDLWKMGKPKKWYYAIPIILLWSLILYLFFRAIF